MKGTILKCLNELIETKFGKEKWVLISEKSGFPKGQIINISMDIDDSMIMKFVENTCSILGISLEQAADAFGDFWVNDYAVKIYKSIYSKFKNVREFVLGMDDVHVMITNSIANAKPPRFTYQPVDDKTIIITYKSSRNLILFYVGLIKGLGRYYNEKLSVNKIDDKTVKVVFL